jgi:hypothetical protein
MNFSHLEMKSRSDSFALGFGTGIKNHTGNNLSGTFNALGSAPCSTKKECEGYLIHLSL